VQLFNLKPCYYEKLALIVFVIWFIGCQSQNNNPQSNTDLKAQRMSEFQQYKEVSKIHSDYLQYVFDHAGPEKLKAYQATRAGGDQTFDVFRNDFYELTTSFIKERFPQQSIEGISAKKLAVTAVDLKFDTATRAGNGHGEVTLENKKIIDFFEAIDAFDTGLSKDEFEKHV